MMIDFDAGHDEREAIYCLVFNENGSALVKGDVVKWALTSEVGTAPGAKVGKSVVDAGAASLMVAGVVRGLGIDNADNIPDDEFGVIQVSGFCDHVTTDGGVGAGDALIAGTAVADTGTLGTNDGAFFGVALEADAGTVLSAAMLKGNI